jgi:hypothetical protein
MSQNFDPYYEWLGIPPKHQPPHHYRLLGIEMFEDNHNVIERAADRQMAHVRTYQTGKHAKLSQQLLNEISSARVCLLDQSKKSKYDEELRTAGAQGDSDLAEGKAAAAELNINIQAPGRPSKVSAVAKRRAPGRPSKVSAVSKRRSRKSSLWVQPAFLVTVVLIISVAVLVALIPYLTSGGLGPFQGGDRPEMEEEPYELPDVQFDLKLPPAESRGPDVPRSPVAKPPSLTIAVVDELAKQPDDDAAPAAEEEVPPEIQRTFGNALGLISDQYAICHAMTADSFVKVARDLRAYGYRPTRIRPYSADGEIRVAAIWTRDGLPWRLIAGVAAATIENADPTLREQGFLPVDAAGIPTTKMRYLTVWAKLPLETDTRQVSLATLDQALDSIRDHLTAAGFAPLTEHVLRTPDHVAHRCRVWEKAEAEGAGEVWMGGEAELKDLLAEQVFPVDVSLSIGKQGRLEYSLVIRRGVERDCQAVYGCNSLAAFDKCKALRDSAMCPIAISVCQNPKDAMRLAASLWCAGE